MINYKWCVCDMDGTLLNSSNCISPEDEAALKGLQKEGVKVMLASGRVDLMLKPYIHQLELDGYVISCNGALIRDIQTDEIVYSRTMDIGIVKKIIRYCIKHEVDFFVYSSNLVYSNQNNSRASNYAEKNRKLSKDLRFTIKYVKDKNLEELDKIEILKVLLICKHQEQVESLQKEFAGYPDITAVSSADGLLDIMAAHTSKGRAIKILGEKMGVGPEQVIAFGDNYNDADMLGCVGMPIAMENSVEDIKCIAKHITKSNNESGIAYAISRFL